MLKGLTDGACLAAAPRRRVDTIPGIDQATGQVEQLPDSLSPVDRLLK